MVCAVMVCAATPGTALVGLAGPTRGVPGVAAQTMTAQTVSWSIPITENEEHNIPSNILKTIFGSHASIIF